MLTNRVFLGAVLLFLAFHLLVIFGIHSPLLESYLDDILCLPIILSITLYAHRRFRVNSNRFRLPLLHILIAFVVIAIGFEVVYPLMTSHGTADVADLLAYGGGAVIFDQWINIA